jgi:hypothetical protein
MLALIPSVLLLVAALTLALLRATRPDFRFSWPLTVASSLLALLMVALWNAEVPPSVTFVGWRPLEIPGSAPAFRGDGLGWPLALSVVALNLAVVLTSGARGEIENSLSWAVTLTASGLSLMAVAAANPLTLVLVWTAVDLTEIAWRLRSVDAPATTERAVASLAVRLAGSGLLVWASLLGGASDFESLSPGAGLFLILAAGLRLGVLPPHVPYSGDQISEGGAETVFRLGTAAASLIAIVRAPQLAGGPWLLGFLMLVTAAAALHGAWQWFIAPDLANAKPYWAITLAALAVAAGLRSSAVGAMGWSTALVLAGGALFLTTVREARFDRFLFVSVWALSALPFSLTAGAWTGELGIAIIFLLPLVVAQALLMAGFVRHTLQIEPRGFLHHLPAWTRSAYPAGIGALLLLQLLLGVWGWAGAMEVGLWPASVGALLLLVTVLWGMRQSTLMKAVPADILGRTSSRLNAFYGGLWTGYRLLGRLSGAVSTVLEGEGGIMWTLLFIVLFISVMTQAVR